MDSSDLSQTKSRPGTSTVRVNDLVINSAPQEWLAGCYEYITDEDPGRTMEEIIVCVEEHLLISSFEDSMLPHTGFPVNISEMDNGRLKGPAILVEVVAMTEIGNSAFNLTSVRQTRIDRADLAGLERGDEQQEEEGYQDPDDAGPIPSYPRSMLKLTLSDGSTTISATEYVRLPQLVLGETPLGCKVLDLSFAIVLCVHILLHVSFLI